jgi:AraC-like DNA-binding protein
MCISDFISLDFLQSSSFVTDKDCKLSGKTTPYYIFAQAIEGNYELSAGGKYEYLSEGEAFLTSPGVPLKIWHHTNKTSKTMRVRYIHFKFQKMGLDPLNSYNFPLRLDLKTSNIIGDIADYFNNCDDNHSVISQVAFMQQAFYLLELIVALGIQKDEKLLLPSMKKAFEYIQSHPNKVIDIDKLTRISGRSRAVFYREFRELTGDTPANFIMRQRILDAAHTLAANPQMTIAELSDRFSFSNQFHFSRQFREIMGCSPRAFKVTWHKV